MTNVRDVMVAAGIAGTLIAASTAKAQDYPYPNGPAYEQYRYGPNEQVVITAPRHHTQRSEIGAPIQDVTMQRAVRFDDLDLRTAWGAERLRARIEFAASEMCRQMDYMYPVSTADSPPCYRTALDNGLYQADEAIRNARGYND